jgi:hypothetical protein
MHLRPWLLLALASCASAPAAPLTAPPAPRPAPAPAPAASAPATSGPVVLPADFVANRIFVRPTMSDGRTLRLYTDSGGGWNFLFDPAVTRLGLPASPAKLGDEAVRITPIPAWSPAASIPAPNPLHGPDELRTSYVVTAPFPFLSDEDGFLGESWFAGRVWTFDYPGKRLLLRPADGMPPHAVEDEIAFHLPHGPHAQSYGRITIRVDGAPIDMLFDTGATLILAPGPLMTLHDGGPPARGTSFIVRTIFEAWRKKHPEWHVIEPAEAKTGEAILEVPRVTVAGHDVGPVWFTRRDDSNFHDFMSADMDARIEGALGGSALKYFVVTVDYPNEKAVFQLPSPSPFMGEGAGG